jgi:nitrogen fixation protein NifZ
MVRDYHHGDMVWSAVALRNDGSFPDVPPQAVMAEPGARGVVVKAGSLEHRPEVRVYLVRFENAEGVLGHPIGCFTEELTQDDPKVKPATKLATEPAPKPSETNADANQAR